MKTGNIFRLFTIIALISLMVPNALGGVAFAGSGAEGGVRSPSASGSFPDSPVNYSLGPAIDYVPVNDGGFENGPPPDSSWFAFSTAGCVDIVDNAYAPPHSGSFVWWGGGYCPDPVTNLIAQAVQVPPDETTLTFFANYYRQDEDDPEARDLLVVFVNRAPVFVRELSLANNTFPDWVVEAIDLSAYAGQTVNLMFLALSRGDLTGNVLVDDIGFGDYVPPAPPANDDFDAATLMDAFPFIDHLDTTRATEAPDDPLLSCAFGGPSPGLATVWYQFTPPANGYFIAHTLRSNYDTMMAVWTGPRGDLTEVMCNDDAADSLQSLVHGPVAAGVTYYVEVTEWTFGANGASKDGVSGGINAGGQLDLHAFFFELPGD